jgi:hypothetical protein
MTTVLDTADRWPSPTSFVALTRNECDDPGTSPVNVTVLALTVSLPGVGSGTVLGASPAAVDDTV